MTMPPDFPGRIARDHLLFRDFEALCAFGGRLSGSESERLALDYVAESGAAASGVPCVSLRVPYLGWRGVKAELVLADGTLAACHPLVRSVATPAGGLTARGRRTRSRNARGVRGPSRRPRRTHRAGAP